MAIARAEKARRAKVRSKLGRLRDRQVKPATVKRYRKHVAHVYSWLRRTGRAVPTTVFVFDTHLMAYAEDLWESGDAKSDLANALSGFAHFVPSLRGQLNGAWRLFQTWSRHELPNRAPCIDVQLLHGFAGYFAWKKKPGCATMLVAGHHCCLRTAEMMHVRTTDVTAGRGVVHMLLQDTKMGGRIGVTEDTTITEPFAADLLRRILARTMQGQTIMDASPHEFRKIWAEACTFLGLPQRYKPYGVRRRSYLPFSTVWQIRCGDE